MTHRHGVLVKNIMLRGRSNCVVCSKSIDSIDESIVVLLNNMHGRVMSNLGLRHAICQRSKHRPVYTIHETLDLVEHMTRSDYKLCPVCKRTWIGSELEELVVASHNGVEHILHKKCL